MSEIEILEQMLEEKKCLVNLRKKMLKEANIELGLVETRLKQIKEEKKPVDLDKMLAERRYPDA